MFWFGGFGGVGFWFGVFFCLVGRGKCLVFGLFHCVLFVLLWDFFGWFFCNLVWFGFCLFLKSEWLNYTGNTPYLH